MSNYQEQRVTADDDDNQTHLTEDAESVDQTRSTASASRRSGTANSRQSQPSTSRNLVTWSSLQIQEENCNHQQADDRFAHLKDVILLDTYNSNVEDAFNVYLPDGMIKFERTDDGLYAYRPTDNYRNQVAESNSKTPLDVNNMVTTVKENKMGFSQKQYENAKKARRLYHIVGCPTVENFKHILRQNIIKNCPVTPEDVNIAEKIFGGEIGTLKGKSTRRRPTPVKDDLVEIPPELLEQHQDLTFCMDIMYINGMPPDADRN
jgi:hypothetical protein